MMLGTFGAALLVAAISVYVLHDVDQHKAGHLNEAFAGLCAEGVIFAVIISGGVALLTFLGSHLLSLKGNSPRPMRALLLGVGVTVLQYPWEFTARKTLPRLADLSLYLYLVFAVVLCTAFLLREGYQLKTSQAPSPHSDIR